MFKTKTARQCRSRSIANTQFFFRQRQAALADATPIATGTGFLAAKNLVRGFKVHVGVVDVAAVPMVAQTVDIEIARYDGYISAPNATSFVYTRNFRTAADDYSITLPYISASIPNGRLATGTQVDGFEWWNLTNVSAALVAGTPVKAFGVPQTDGSIKTSVFFYLMGNQLSAQ